MKYTNEVMEEISKVIKRHIEKHGEDLYYVDIPYLLGTVYDGQSIQTLSVLTPKGKKVLQLVHELQSSESEV